MSAEPNRWATAAAAEAVAAHAPLGDEARARLSATLSPKQFVDALLKDNLGLDAMRVIPFALTPRQAIWWAAQCVCSQPDFVKEPKLAEAVAAAERWCASPSDANRRAALTAAETAEVGTPAGCVALAVFLADGSLAPANVAAVPPPPHLGQTTAANAVQLAAVLKEPEKAAEKYAAFVTLADAVASGANVWKAEPAAAPTSEKPPPPAPKPKPVELPAPLPWR